MSINQKATEATEVNYSEVERHYITRFMALSKTQCVCQEKKEEEMAFKNPSSMAFSGLSVVVSLNRQTQCSSTHSAHIPRAVGRSENLGVPVNLVGVICPSCLR